MAAPEANVVYIIELCSGERRRWRCLGSDARAIVWWHDMDSGLEFNEGSLMYAWHIVGKAGEVPEGDGVVGG